MSRTRLVIGQLIIRQMQVAEHQITKCGWNGTGELIIRQIQGCEWQQISQCGWNGTGQLIVINK